MALTKTPIELSSTPSIVDGGNATAITIDSSENLGIGVTPESHYTGYVGIDFGKSGGLFSNASGTNLTGLSNNAYLNSDASAWVYKETDEASYYNQTAGTHRFSVAPSGTAGNAITWSESMRIDSSGNLLVGKTTTDNTTAGARIHPAGYASFTIANDFPIIANRLSSDGDIAVFRKDGANVGSIGATGTNTYINSQGGTFKINTAGTERYNFDLDQIYPTVDNDTNLGLSSKRFKDLYLSGGAYLGGTAAANKLEDYEEGTWTMGITTSSASSISFTNTTGNYTKVGNLVTVGIYTAAMTVSNAGGGTLDITGLPFTVAAGEKSYTAASFAHTSLFATSYSAYPAINTTFARVTQVGNILNATLSAGYPKYMMFTLTYFAA